MYNISVVFITQAAMAQSVARRLGKAEVGGSSPLDSFLILIYRLLLIIYTKQES